MAILGRRWIDDPNSSGDCAIGTDASQSRVTLRAPKRLQDLEQFTSPVSRVHYSVGMGLVGGVALTPDVGAERYKGEEFGCFQFGGSDVIMVFQKDMVEITAEVGQRYFQGQEFRKRLASDK